MEQTIYELSLLLEQDRNLIRKCLKQTARIHQRDMEEILHVLIQSKEELVSPREAPKKTGPTHESLVARAREVSLKGAVKKLEKLEGKKGVEAEKQREKLALEAIDWIRKNPALYTEEYAWKTFGEVAPFTKSDEVRYSLARLLLQHGVAPSEIAVLVLEDPSPSRKNYQELFQIGVEVKNKQLKVPEHAKVRQEIASILWNVASKSDRQQVAKVLME